MKRLFICFVLLILISDAFSQSPEKMSYQSVIRNSNNQLVTNQVVGMKISILQSTPTGTAVYSETQTPTTNANGLVTVEIGGGTVTSGTFASIDWANGPYFLKTETDPTGGTNYTITGICQLLSVPYALYAKTAENGFSGDYNDLVNKPANLDEDKTDDMTLSDNQAIPGNKTFTGIVTVNSPSNLGDAANKAYVDALRDIIHEEILMAGLNGILEDIEGNLYKTIAIGSQVWMADNLKVTKFNDGTSITLVTDQITWYHYTTTPAYVLSFTNTNPAVGIYYNGYSIETDNLCPSGWHVPTDEEWTTLEIYLQNNDFNYDGSSDNDNDRLTNNKIAMSMAYPWGWNSVSHEGPSAVTGSPGDPSYSLYRNKSGFSAQAEGYTSKLVTEFFAGIGENAGWWSSTESDENSFYYRSMSILGTGLNRNDKELTSGLSVRCIKDL